jgi:S-(hydroxymethyl)glutathione dehydrogenase/alcohol dehydrogenase
VRAAVLREAGEPFSVEQIDLAPLDAGSIRVRLAASGVCRSDLSVVRGVIPQAFPTVLGHEGAGVVVEAGDAAAGVEVGDHVILSCVAPCRVCAACLRGEIELCEHGMDHAFGPAYARSASGGDIYAAFGLGTFAEETVVPASAAVVIDRDFPLDLASLIGCGVVTGVGAVLRSARVTPGETVAIIGCGGVGLSAIQGARVAGAARIIAVDTVPSKLDRAIKAGATDAVDASAVEPIDAVREVTGGAGVDHAVEVVGLSATILQAYGMARRGGTVTIVGAGSFDDMVSISAMQLMADAKTIRGCVYGATDPARDFPVLLDLARRGAIDLEQLVTQRIDLDDLDAAFAAMDSGSVARSLVVFG